MQCRICGCNADHPVYAAKEVVYGYDESFDYFHCQNCGCFQILDFPDDISKYYQNAYYSLQNDPYDSLSPFRKKLDYVKDYLTFFWSRRIGKVFFRDYFSRKWITMPKWRRNLRILDIGCGSGLLLRRLHRLGFEHLLGVDPNIDTDVKIDKDFEIKKQTIEQTTGVFDLIILSHSLEHIPDQHAVFSSLKRLIAPDGEIVILIPIYSDYFFERYHDAWYSLDVPRHFYLHTRNSLETLVQESGLKIEKQVYYSFLNCITESEQRLAKMGVPDAQRKMDQYTSKQWRDELNRINRQNLSDCCNFVIRPQ